MGSLLKAATEHYARILSALQETAEAKASATAATEQGTPESTAAGPAPVSALPAPTHFLLLQVWL